MASLVFKILAMILGCACIIYGIFIGVIGIGPEGWVSLPVRGVGMGILLIGVFYCYPNSKIVEQYWKVKLYYAIGVLPPAIALCGIGNIVLRGYEDYTTALLWMIALLVWSLFAPLSLKLHMRKMST